MEISRQSKQWTLDPRDKPALLLALMDEFRNSKLSLEGRLQALGFIDRSDVS